MPLTYAPIGEPAVIRKITGKDEVRQHLAELGFVVGQQVTVVSSLAGNLIINVKGSRIALDAAMAQRVMLYAFFGLKIAKGGIWNENTQGHKTGRNGHHRQAARRRCCQAAHHGHGVDQGNTGLCQKGGSAGRPDRSQCAQL